jgi:hypothetical protein
MGLSSVLGQNLERSFYLVWKTRWYVVVSATSICRVHFNATVLWQRESSF